MPVCRNCGSHVTAEYVRVLSRRDADGVVCCPDCPDVIRDRHGVRESRATRNQDHDPVRYDPDYDTPDWSAAGGDD